jgi:hypothetical protein
MTEEIVDGQVVTDPKPGSELVQTRDASANSTLFNTSDPVEVVERASAVAGALKDILRSQGMVQKIQGREHVLVSGWQTLGSMLGVVPVVVWTKELPNGWEARVEARTLDGRVVGAAEAMCTTDERTWKSRDAYALRSMAQTRATSKALRGPLGFVVTLAGYDATPAEEIPHAPTPQAEAPASPTVASPSDIRLIYQQASGKLTGLQLLNVLREARGEEPEDRPEQEALARVRDVIRTLPADKVPVVLERVNA